MTITFSTMVTYLDGLLPINSKNVMTITFSRMVTYLDGLLPINSKNVMIT